MAESPAFLVYLCGHMRSFPLISARQRLQWDTLADGASYLIFVHTWHQIDHQQTVWYRRDPNAALQPELRSLNTSSLLMESSLKPRLAAFDIEWHPGLERFRNGSDDVCISGITCVSDAIVQLYELKRVHDLARRFFAQPQNRHLLGRRRLEQMPVIRSRPDVTMRTAVSDGRSYSKVDYPPLEPIRHLVKHMRAKESDDNFQPGIFGCPRSSCVEPAAIPARCVNVSRLPALPS